MRFVSAHSRIEGVPGYCRSQVRTRRGSVLSKRALSVYMVPRPSALGHPSGHSSFGLPVGGATSCNEGPARQGVTSS